MPRKIVPDLQREHGLTIKQMSLYEAAINAFAYVPDALVKTALFQLARALLTVQEIETLGNELGRLADEKARVG